MSTISLNSREDLGTLRRQLVARLSGVRRKVRLWILVEAVAIITLETAGLALFTFFADHTFRLGVPARISMLTVAAAILLVEFWRRIVRPLTAPIALVPLAGALSHRVSGHAPDDLAAHIASVLELPQLVGAGSGPSAAMVDRAVRRRHAALADVDFGSVLDTGRLVKMLALLAMSVAVPVSLAFAFPDLADLWARRLFLASRQPWPQNTYLQVADEHDGRILVPRGEPYVLRANARDGSQAPGRISLTLRGADRTTVLMKQFGDNDFRHDLAVVEQPLELWLQGGDDDYGPVALEPVDRPRIAMLELSAQHPRQKTPQTFHFSGDADLSFLVKTKLTLSVTANLPLKELRLKPQSPAPRPADLRRIDERTYAVSWEHGGPAKFELELVAAQSGLVSLPAPVSIGLKSDTPPRVTMSVSGVRQRVTPQATFPLSIDARDDYGVASVHLSVKTDTPDPNDPAKLTSRTIAQPLFPAAGSPPPQSDALPLELPLKHTLAVAEHKLAPGSFLAVTAEATDDCFTGTQTGRSRTVIFGIVSPEELFRDILLRQQNERIKFRKATEEADKIREALPTLTQAKQLADIARRHRALQLEALRITTVLGESLTEIKLNGLGSPESHALMERNVLAPLKSLADELLSPQTAAIDGLTPTGPDAAIDPTKLAAVSDRQEQIVARMKTVLSQMSQWDSFVDVLNQLDQIIKLETGVKDGSTKLRKKETDSLFDN